MRTFFPYDDPDGQWRGRIIMLVTFSTEDGRWGTVLFKGVVTNYDDDDDDDNGEINFKVDYENPIRRIISHTEDDALDVHVTMLRDLPRLAKELTAKLSGDERKANHSMDYIM